ncbi:MAG: serine hydrolase [Saprospiraceae bacterium]|nr:serine hydrolase [Saprospiraceae bacterium]
MTLRKLLFVLIIMAINADLSGQVDKKAQWVDSIYNAMNEDQRLGQLFMMRAFSYTDQKHIDQVKSLIQKYQIGGLCFFQGSPENQALLVNTYQSLSRIPLLTAIDGEWGLSMRFKGSVTDFPRQLMLGAIQDDNLIYEFGKEVAMQCKATGIHVNFAPVADVNNNPDNPVINDRSFGEDIYNVAAKSFAYMKGMQDYGIVACAKHFPGHGDTGVDSHYDLPVIKHNTARLDSLELMPFKVLSDQGVKSMMVAHLHMPAYDDRPNRPTTLSRNVITELLRKKLGFNGVVFTDAMEMKGVLNHFPTGEAEAEALLAGNDMIVLTMDIDKSMKKIKEYINSGKINKNQVTESVKRILAMKYELGLSRGHQPLNPALVDEVLNRPESIALKSRLTRAAITLVNDTLGALPVQQLNDSRYATLSIGKSEYTPFQERISDYLTTMNLKAHKDMDSKRRSRLLKELKKYDQVIVSIHDMSKLRSKGYGVSDSTLQFLDVLYKQNKVTTVLFGSPYALEKWGYRDQMIVAYNEDPLTQDITAQAICGATPFRGRLPVSVGSYKYGQGEDREDLARLGYDIPESVGMSSATLASIDTLMAEMISDRAAPGCQILVAKDGKIVFDKSYGYFTYAKKRKVTPRDIYDVASVTKILASTLSMMKLQDEGKVNVKDRVSKYITQLDTTNKKEMTFEEMMAHHARLIGWIPFYVQTITDNKRNPRPLPEYYRRTGSGKYSIPVAKNLYLRTDYRDSIWSKIYSSKLREREGYRYSDLAFYLVHNAINNITGKGVDEYATESFYKPLGLKRTGFNPHKTIKLNNIIPSEEDVYFRRQRLTGYVHDMGAAMLGGVSGHAGLFSNSREIAIMMQMLLNGGHYGGKKFLNQETVKQFTSRYRISTRRGIGFDMKELNPDRSQNMSSLASDQTFGHLGFTGTAVFADPEHNLVYVFLSNRTYPRMENTRFIRDEYRPRVQSIVYKSLLRETLP